VHTRALTADLEAAQAAVRQARHQADVVVFAVHWGVPPFWRAPFQGDLAEYQQPVGRALIDAGADLVVGHHPHSLQGIEVYQGKPIVYSLGNFIFHMPLPVDDSPLLRRLPYRLDGLKDRRWTESMLLMIDIGRPGNAAYEMWPLSVDFEGNPHLLENEEARNLIERVADLSRPFGAHVVFDDGRGRLVLR
jgi:poly-gamma-glutamate capsule biosynthesis protein CapA/YwtB (metallophosphatase superfamily)